MRARQIVISFRGKGSLEGEGVARGLAPGFHEFRQVRPRVALGLNQRYDIGDSGVIGVDPKRATVLHPAQVHQIGVQDIGFAVVADINEAPVINHLRDIGAGNAELSGKAHG